MKMLHVKWSLLDILQGVMHALRMVSNTIREHRKKKNLSQQRLADLATVSRQTIHAVEASKSDPSLELALRLSQILECPVEKLFKLISSEVKKERSDVPPPFSLF
jgi:putative transcriptional regulator